MKIAWLTDIHLNFVESDDLQIFLNYIDVDALMIGGDIGESDSVIGYLQQFVDTLKMPTYFVLGNHDYYGGSIVDTRSRVSKFSTRSEYCHWLPESGIIELNNNTCLFGHGSWADTKYGNYMQSFVELNDYYMIVELTGKDRFGRMQVMMELAADAALYTRRNLAKAVQRYDHIYFLTHVPPFKEATWHLGNFSDDNWLPHFSCKAVGDVLLEVMQANPDKQLTVLCGHTHSSGEAHPIPNITVYTGQAEYGSLRIQKEFEY